MNKRLRDLLGVSSALVVLAASAATGVGGDWPAYRHDAGRSACTGEGLANVLHRQWTYKPRHAPCPAWPEPVRETHLMSFDHGFQTVVSQGTVYFGSSADHQVRALHLANGQQRWTFFTDAPVRFAPAVYRGRVYVASDDGRAYCLAASDGRPLWTFRAGPEDRRLLGNEAMISRWPLRGGLLVDDGRVYFTAGMWPSMGVYAYALDAADGKVVWKQQADAKFAPQGYMAANGRVIVAPAGRCNAWAIDREKNQLRPFEGMSQAIVRENLYLSGPFTHKANENLPVGRSWPLVPRSRKIVAWKLDAGRKKLGDFGGKDVAATSGEAIYLAGQGKIAAYAVDGMKRLWEVDHARVFSLAVAGDILVAAGDGRVALLESTSGKTLWSAPVDGRVRGLAVADQRLLASCEDGRIICFAADKPPEATIIRPPDVAPDRKESESLLLAERILNDTRIAAGFCLLTPAGDGRLALDLARRSNLRIYVAERDRSRVAAVRKLADDAGLYGTRITVHHVDSDALPYPDYFADLIVADNRPGGPGYLPDELHRVLRPCGGTAFVLSAAGEGKDDVLRAAASNGDLTETRLSPTARKIVRGKLPGAGNWTHQYADAGRSGSSADRLVRWPLEVLWFGKPGPGRMMNRHWRNSAPLCIDGRMFILGQHGIMAVDAYNGRQLWSRQLPSIGRRVVDIRGGSMVADRQSIYLATADVCFRLGAKDGRVEQVYRLPVTRPRFSLKRPQTIQLGQLGKVEMRNTPAALVLKLTSVDSKVTNADRQNNPAGGDSWELFFDFRKRPDRDARFGPGAFHAIIVPASSEKPTATWQIGQWSGAAVLEVSGTLDAGGSQTEVRIPWAKMAELVGGKPSDFNFGLILNSSDDGRQLSKRTCRFANDGSYRLANCWAEVSLGGEGSQGSDDRRKSIPAERIESLTWGNLINGGDVLLGTLVESRCTAPVLTYSRDFSSHNRDYTGPPAAKVLGELGLAAESRHVFALSKKDGRLLWTYNAVGAVPHNGLALYDNRVYLLDKPAAAENARLDRRGQAAANKSSLVVLDLATGKRLWTIDQGLEDHVGLRLGKGVLLAVNLRGMTALDAEDGKRLWSVDTVQPMHHCSAFVRAPVIAGDWVYDEPHAYRLTTGKPRDDGQGKPWRWGGFRGCGTVSASENMLLFRTGTPAFLDVGGNSGLHNFPALRPGCYINMITAGGLVLMPEASSGCGCAYNFQTTVVLSPRRN